MKSFALIILSALLCFPLHAATLIADPFPPARFTGLYIEKDDAGTSVSIQLAGDAVIYKVTQGDKVLETATTHPDGDAWFKFIQGLNGAKVYQWAPKYEYPGQGATWVIDLTMEDRKFTSMGTNEYPKDGNEAQPAANPKAGPSLPFQLFWQAALELAGKTTSATK